MSVDALLFVLRIGFLVLLYVFLIAVVRAAWGGVRRAAAARDAVTPPSSRVRLRVLAAPEPALARASFDLWSSATLGRAPDNTIVLGDQAVSAHHAAIRHQHGQWWLEDLLSTNGTAVNDRRLSQPGILNAGDVVQLGDVRLRLEIDQPEPA
ncbi:MAG: FHA domain-containing protein [Chloroflexota bacterium]